MQSRGVVKSVGKTCKVDVIRQSACGENCANCGGCRLTETEIIAENVVGAKAGDKVILEVSDKAALGAAGLAYILPIVLLLISLLVCYFMDTSEGITIVISLSVLILSCLGTALFAKRKKERFKVKIVKILT